MNIVLVICNLITSICLAYAIIVNIIENKKMKKDINELHTKNYIFYNDIRTKRNEIMTKRAQVSNILDPVLKSNEILLREIEEKIKDRGLI